jgi:hypothetical protein
MGRWDGAGCMPWPAARKRAGYLLVRQLVTQEERDAWDASWARLLAENACAAMD